MVQGAQSIYRTVDILDVLLGSHGGMTAKEVIEVAGLPASTTHRILTVLCERGLVRQDRQTRRYFPGNVWMADCLWELPRMLYNRYYDLLPRLVQEFGYTGYLLCRMGYECLCLARVESSFCVQVFTSGPARAAFWATGREHSAYWPFLRKRNAIKSSAPISRFFRKTCSVVFRTSKPPWMRQLRSDTAAGTISGWRARHRSPCRSGMGAISWAPFPLPGFTMMHGERLRGALRPA